MAEQQPQQTSRVIRIPMGMARALAAIAPLYYRLRRLKARFTPYALETLTSKAWISHKRAEDELGYLARPLYSSLTDTVQ